MALSWVLTSSRSDTSWVANENYVAVLIVSPKMTGGSCWARQSHWIYPNIRDTAYHMDCQLTAHALPYRSPSCPDFCCLHPFLMLTWHFDQTDGAN
jgi:hypothetical protein